MGRDRSTLLAAALAAACSPAGTGPRAAVLVTFDTTRADALRCLGGEARWTPNLDRLASEGVLFQEARTVAPLTLPAHASMLTGLWPPRHGVRDNGLWPLPEEARTVAEIAREAGVQTAAFVGAVVLDETFGLAQGFETYSAPGRERQHRGSHFTERPARAVVDDALAWLTARDRARPFLLWVHFFDPHGPYEPDPAFRARALGNAYLGEVAAADDALGRLVDALRTDGALAGTVLLVAGDHGEAFGEHGEEQHGSFVWDSTLRVPMLLWRGPRGAPDRRGRSAAPVSVVDVAPTLIEALGLDPPPGLDGVSLLERDPPPGRGRYFESYEGALSYGWAPLAGWIDRDGKYVHGEEPRFYDVARDPLEEHDLAPSRPDLERYRRAIAAVADAPGLPRASDRSAGPELLAELRALGYAGTGVSDAEVPHPLDVAGRPDPLERAEERAVLQRGLAFLEAGDAAGAEAVFRAVLAERPDHPFALDRLASALMMQGRHPEAIPVLERLVADGPGWAGSWFNLGLCLREVGRADEAVTAFEGAVARQPNQPLFLEYLARALDENGSVADAAQVRARLEDLDLSRRSASERSPRPR